VPASIATAPLRPADPADLTQALAFAARYRGRKRVETGADSHYAPSIPGREMP
jgi:hypothetical protein